ncbi:cytochrome c-type protein NapC [Azoarcus sp. DD4]|uniref:NapC/NirT family cytochrome c n=1 Tax=Azoarcus sp. DD4 TaxID=2027405 RepID=UPI001128BE74|nr:NapC/NirT family cytochrome c [Azoarcus sp. DD4]QDF99505.1 cytochrome c-type protein NapC [Azoarcus sp. DD4]
MTDNNNSGLWAKLRRAGWGLLGVAFVGGIIFWGGFNWALEMTNKEQFCISCHEMEENVYREYRNTIHYQNRTGVRATCPDCHVPKEWGPKIVRKIKASNEVWHKMLGSIDTPEKFNAKRLQLAQNEWRRMKANNSQECRNCHNYEYFDYSVQGRRSNKMHQAGLSAGQTCIDCHKGIAHSLPPIEQEIGAGRDSVAPEVFHPAAPQQAAPQQPAQSQ